ncbi:uncharacterized protein KQ657_004769 [Scheffersomyces spartinae]|uniref:AB hydrolase-1 domain-containing protein n=1 Tax=Scheffersomyces spartinae TaxID=45513 RepID=A0A9P7VAU4_9ASCO|nr:uncharacterized protein KQ657_004769 [Scheffersomyces spartinae]KAG7194554.1 hypothetical protein KQ657_004769 [Scheffersomyces spartinae]
MTPQSEQPEIDSRMAADQLHPATPQPVRDTSSSEELPLLGDEEQDQVRASAARRRQAYVDPDDPIVSPMNLKWIRILHYSVGVLMMVNFIVLLGILISQFIAIPGFTGRGLSFTLFDLVVICLVADFLVYWKFTVAGKWERVGSYICISLLVIDLVVVLTVGGIRDVYGFLGAALILWTLATFVFTTICDYKVEQSRKAQEIRYTGRVEKRRSIGELLVLFLKAILKLGLVWLVWCLSLTLYLQAFDTHIKPWGKLIPVHNNEFKVHLACFGDVHLNKTLVETQYSSSKLQPIVLVEGGQLDSSESFQEWIEELYHLKKIQRYCIWDRPGYGFSEGAPSPQSFSIIVEYLNEALNKEGIEGPFSLVGFDIGGLYSRVFAGRRPGNIHSMLLVDSWSEDLLKTRPFAGLKNENKKDFRGVLEFMDPLVGIKLWFRGLASPFGILLNIHWFFHPKKYSSNSRIFGSEMVRQPKYLLARLQEQTTAAILSYNEVVVSDVKSIPLSVVSSEYMIKNSINWGKWQRQLTRLSDQPVEWEIVESASHFLWKNAKGRKQLQDVLIRLIEV